MAGQRADFAQSHEVDERHVRPQRRADHTVEGLTSENGVAGAVIQRVMADPKHISASDLATLQRVGGNGAVIKLIRTTGYGPPAGGKGTGGGGTGGGKISGASESYYDVSGETLASLAGQLTACDGFGAKTAVDITINGKVTPQKVGEGYQVQVTWITKNAIVTLPRWSDYGKACAEAQTEWNRFMGATRAHEQQAHVNAAKKFCEELTGDDVLIKGSTVEEVTSNLQAKQVELAGRLQALHDKCDHGVGVGAVLDTSKGASCKKEEESESGGEESAEAAEPEE